MKLRVFFKCASGLSVICNLVACGVSVYRDDWVGFRFFGSVAWLFLVFYLLSPMIAEILVGSDD